MLVLTMKPHERLFIGKDVSVMVIRATSRNIRIAIEAPDEVNIVREEVLRRSDPDDLLPGPGNP